jgi:hypothetical protein
MLNILKDNKNNLMRLYPLRYFVKMINRMHPEGNPYTIEELYNAANFLWNSKKIDTYTMTLIRAEAGNLDDVKLAITDMYHICSNYKELTDEEIVEELELMEGSHSEIVQMVRMNMLFMPSVPLAKIRRKAYNKYKDLIKNAGYDVSLYEECEYNEFLFGNITLELLTDFANRFAVDSFRYILEYILDERYGYITFDAGGWGSWYPLSKGIRDTFVNLLPHVAGEEIDASIKAIGKGPKDLYGYGLCMPDRLYFTLRKAIRYSDHDLFVEYAKQYFNVVDEVYLKYLFTLNDKAITEDIVRELYERFGGYK